MLVFAEGRDRTFRLRFIGLIGSSASVIALVLLHGPERTLARVEQGFCRPDLRELAEASTLPMKMAPCASTNVLESLCNVSFLELLILA
jgi:hypothetical protein